MKLLSALIGNRDFKAFAASIMDGSTNSLDDVSGGSSAEFPCDRATSPMEVRLQAQEDEITLLKSSLADALRRLRLHDQQMLLLKQHLIAVNPGAARSLSQLCCADGLSRPCRHSSSSQDGLSPLTNSTGEENGHSHGHHGPSAANLPKQRPTPPACQDRATQTELTLQGMGPGQERVPLALTRAVQSLSLEDALLEGGGLSVAQETLSTLEEGELEEEEEDEDDEQDGGRMKDSTWAPGVEDAIQPTRLVRSGRGVGAEAQDHNGGSSEDQGGSSPSSAPHTPSSGSPAPPKEQCHSPLPPIMEDGKKTLVRRNSERQMRETPDRTKQRLGKKAASSANLLARSPSLESRTKDLISTPGSQGSSRGRTTQGQSIKMFLRGRPITMYIPSNIQNYEDLKMDLPPEKLELDWVYGYRGRDCRANLYLLPSGEAVYFIACVVVLYHLSQRTQRHYRKHTDCVRCLAIHPDKIRVASGQTAGVDKDGKPLQPFVNIWDSTTLTTLQTIGLGTLERGVSSVAFSQSDSGASLCVVDESNEHMLSVWDWAKGVKHAEVKSTNEAVLAVEFNPSDSNNIITSGKSHVHFWMLSSGAFTKKQGIFGKYKKPKFILCFVFSLTGDVLTGDSEGNILTWGKSRADTKTLGKGAKETFQIMRQTRAHEGSVFTLYVLQGGALLSGGGKDRKIIRWSADLAPERECEIPEQYGAVRTIADVDGEELLVGTTRNAILRGTFSDGFTAIVQGHVDEMWGLATHPSQNIFLTCGNDKQLCLWSAEEHSLDWSTTLEESGLCADFCPSGTVVSVGLNTGRWLVLDLRTREVVSDLTDGNEQHSVMRYSPDGSYLAVGSHDNFIYIYSVSESGRRYTRFGKCTGHSSFITHLDWSKDGKYIMSNSGDYEILYWDVAGGCKLLRNRYESKDREWASYTCVLGFHVMGVWLEGSDGTDINALCRSHNERLVAMADDFCKVHLFQYPCPKPKAPSHKYEGHGSHVTNVCFTSSDSHLLSLGGKDTCILQWRVTGGPGPGPSGGHREQRQAQQTPPPAFAASAPASASASASSTSTNSPEPGM